MSIEGSCLCGRVRYRISGKLHAASHCHCSMCRRQHGAVFATYAGFDPGEFRWVAGEEQVSLFEPSPQGGWCFCSECGSSLAGTENGRVTSITLATVDGDPGIRPESHIFTGSRAHWHDITDALPQFDEWPPDSREPPDHTS